MINSTPASEFVTDTIALVLRLEQRKLGATAKSIFEALEAGSATIHVPALVLAEILYLSEKKRITISLANVAAYFKRYPNCKEFPMNFAVVQAAGQISDVRELHDRLIAGAARSLRLDLITNDASIRASSFVKTVW